MLNHHYPLLIIKEEYLYSILLQKCLIMLLLNCLVAVCKPQTFFLLIEIYNDLSNADHSGLNLGLFVYLYYPFCLVFMFMF